MRYMLVHFDFKLIFMLQPNLIACKIDNMIQNIKFRGKTHYRYHNMLNIYIELNEVKFRTIIELMSPNTVQ